MFKRKVKKVDHRNNKKCSYCGKTGHTSMYCYAKPVVSLKTFHRLNPESPKAKKERVRTAAIWHQNNPPDENGNYECYLKISALCPQTVSREILTLEHVYPRAKFPELKYNWRNIKASCPYCNKLKGSNTIEKLALMFPQVALLIETKEWQVWQRKLNIRIISPE